MRTRLACALVALLGVLLLTGADTFQVVNPSGVASPEYQSETWLFCLDDSGSVHTEWPASPDSIIEDAAGEDFIFDIVDRANADTTLAGTSTPSTQYGTGANNSLPYASQKFIILWFDLSKLPEDITILDAKLCVISNSTTTPAPYGRYAVLDTCKRDERMQHPTSLYHSTSGFAQVWEGRASWNKPRQSSADPWVPLLNNRDDIHDYGIRSELLSTATTAGSPATFEVDYAVQHYAKYRHANAGFWICGTSATTGTFGIRCGPAIPIARLPFLKVTFIRKPYRFPWDGYPVAFAFSTDDQVVDNNTWKATADSFGYKYTLYMRGDTAPFASTTASMRLTVANIQDFYNDGYEIGHHTLDHLDDWGLGEIVSDQDSMNAQVERSWLSSATGIPTTSIRTLSYSGGGFNILAQKTVQNYGYLMARCAGDTATDNAYPPWSTADGAKQLRLDRTRNLFAVERASAANVLFGTAAADTFSHATIKDRFYDAIDASVRNGYFPLLYYVHDTKTRTTYTDGMDPDDWSSLCRIIQQNGRVGVFTMTQIAQMYRNRNMPVDAPAWADRAVADGQVAADSLWWGGGME